MKQLSIGVVIPTLDEEEAILQHLPAIVSVADRVVVCDGGSRDATTAAAQRLGAEVVTAPVGRGSQLNRGAAEQDTDILLFLHADTTLPDGAVDAVRAAIADGAVGGGFSVRFSPQPPMLTLGAALINLRTRWTRAPLGDQAQFTLRRTFLQIDGFRDWSILEDLDFIRRLRRAGRIAVLRQSVTTSSRRFLQRGIVRTVATNWVIWLLYLVGVSPHRLARHYRQVR